MERVFIGAEITGKYRWTPGETSNQLELEGQSDNAADSGDSNEWVAYNHSTSPKMVAMMNSATINGSDSGSKRKSMRKKLIMGAEALASNMDDLVNSVKRQSKEPTVNHVIAAHNYTIAKAIARLYTIEALDPTDPFLHYEVILIDILNNRELLMSIPTDQGIIMYLQE
ncbi:hypothetical protein ACSBR1_036381 [Camellia fascicularis]